uniref:Uncharacterized protein n=1 Tax=Glossina palpalis gambiensis TaxID=67801 RepID=A0A1B0B207_9MUSC
MTVLKDNANICVDNNSALQKKTNNEFAAIFNAHPFGFDNNSLFNNESIFQGVGSKLHIADVLRRFYTLYSGKAPHIDFYAWLKLTVLLPLLPMKHDIKLENSQFCAESQEPKYTLRRKLGGPAVILCLNPSNRCI